MAGVALVYDLICPGMLGDGPLHRIARYDGPA
jgi:hypothetical protein